MYLSIIGLIIAKLYVFKYKYTQGLKSCVYINSAPFILPHFKYRSIKFYDTLCTHSYYKSFIFTSNLYNFMRVVTEVTLCILVSTVFDY